MKYFELDKEEKELLDSLEKEGFESVKNVRAEMIRYREYAKNSLNRTRNINIRLSERDLQKLKAKAVQKGIPYQTLVSSILHQYGDANS